MLVHTRRSEPGISLSAISVPSPGRSHAARCPMLTCRGSTPHARPRSRLRNADAGSIPTAWPRRSLGLSQGQGRTSRTCRVALSAPAPLRAVVMVALAGVRGPQRCPVPGEQVVQWRQRHPVRAPPTRPRCVRVERIQPSAARWSPASESHAGGTLHPTGWRLLANHSEARPRSTRMSGSDPPPS